MIVGLVLAKAPGYSETFFRSKIKGLQDSGHTVVVFCSDDDNVVTYYPVILMPKQYANVFKQLGMFLWVYIGLLPHLKSVSRFISLERRDGVSWVRILKSLYNYAPILKTDLDWLHFGFGTLAIGAENLAGAKNVKMAVSFRGFDIGIYPIKYPNCYDRLWDKVSKIHVISDDIANLLHAHGFKDQAPIVKITPAIDTGYFSASQLKEFESPLQLLTAARLHWKKGLDYTLEALALLKAAGVSFEYRIIGTGPEEEALKFACYQLGLEDEVFFLGKLAHDEVKYYMDTAKMYIQYSVQEGFCNSVLEAQSMGLLCVVSDAEGLTENVLDGQTGWVVPKRLPEQLAGKIRTIIGLSGVKKQTIEASAMSRIKRKFNIEKQQEEFIRFYTQ